MKTSIFNRSVLIFFHVFFLVGIALLWQPATGSAQDQEKLDNEPLHVISDKMVAQKDASMVEFIGNVKATRVDSIVFADSIKIYFNEKNKNDDAQGNVKKIVSSGNVEYTDTAGEQQAFADKAVYTAHDDVLVLTGKSPKLVTGSNFVTGKKITLFRKQDKVIVESDGSKRVEALFNPEDKTTEKQ